MPSTPKAKTKSRATTSSAVAGSAGARAVVKVHATGALSPSSRARRWVTRLRDDISRSGYFMTIVAVVSLAVAIFGRDSEDRILVVPIPATAHPPQEYPLELRPLPVPMPTIIVS